ncbi:MAG: MHYT domain-containing protein [Acidiferrobacter thiooxydans]
MALSLIGYYHEEVGGERWTWLAGASVALGGCAIWAMHFIAMLAFRLPVAVNYNLGVTALSLVLAIAATALGIFVVDKYEGSLIGIVGGGTITGIGVAGMHYLGMSAMRMAATMSFNIPLVIVSVVIAIVAASVAFWLARNATTTVTRAISALVMGVAVCGMHYTGMAATHFRAAAGNAQAMFAANSLSPYTMGIWVFGITALVLAFIVFSSALRTTASDV